MSRRVLIVLSEFGYWGEELVGPVEVLEARGYRLTYMTPNGGRPVALPPSLDPDYVDPPLGRSVTTRDMARRAADIDSSSRLDNPLSLSDLIPERPYYSALNHLRELEEYHRNLTSATDDLVASFDALVIVGGSGPIVDLANNERLHEVVLAFTAADKPILAECYGVAVLAFARDLESRESILWGKHVTGHPKEYDYKDGTGFVGVDFNMGPPPYPLEYILRDATGPDGAFIGNVGRELSAIVDHPFITARSTPDSTLSAELLVRVLEEGLRRYGW
ncbi:type 1 glutamine amidotransferase domain-containing protein [Streptomyces sp. 3MP-14]|uniref:Type 1 glutamine amidotransferase domain-containing protein n=1 Tax=Streptomyces mimosae TaxID=2586635 RepID=A0A5N6AN67_9ACTN|nr:MULTISPECIES: type 1 glutamine amidotransferase domain-containing protein [Streptomyces]KAB8169655.1 type 1 glutamine amidotransferase domain-containing protein [Streptomyces mimosae]KAB8178403.1 type 1 glutamine amidotransferase domain-containing protein [Streptomyces sp. 3MP-14]